MERIRKEHRVPREINSCAEKVIHDIVAFNTFDHGKLGPLADEAGLGRAVIKKASGVVNLTKSPFYQLKCKRPAQFDFEGPLKAKITLLEEENGPMTLPNSPISLEETEPAVFVTPNERSFNYGRGEYVKSLELGEGSGIKESDRMSCLWKKEAKCRGVAETPPERTRKTLGERRYPTRRKIDFQLAEEAGRNMPHPHL